MVLSLTQSDLEEGGDENSPFFDDEEEEAPCSMRRTAFGVKFSSSKVAS